MDNENIEIIEDNNKKKGSKRPYVIAILMALLLVITITATSYAYFTANVSGTGHNTVVTTTSLEIEFTDGPQVALENAVPGQYIEKTFKVENKGSGDTPYDVYMSEVINDFADKSDLVYTLTSSDGGANISETQVPDVNTKIVNSHLLRAGETHNYVLRITFKETNDNQDDNKGKNFSTVIRINEVKNIETNNSTNYTIVSGDLDTIGSIVKIANEEFYVIGQEDTNHVKLLSKYNLNVGNELADGAIGIQNSEARGRLRNSYSSVGAVIFTDNSYWYDNDSLKEEYGTSFPAYIYTNEKVNGNYLASIAQYVDNYINYLETQNVEVTGRLINLEELVNLGCNISQNSCTTLNGGSAPEWLYYVGFWSGTASDDSNIYAVFSDGYFYSDWIWSGNYYYGVRPVIIMEK